MIDNIIDRWTECGVSLGSTCAISSLDVGILVSLCALGALGSLYVQRVLRWLLMLNARSFTPALSRVLAPWVKSNDYLGQDFFRADGAEEAIVTRRQQALERLATFFQDQHPRSVLWGNEIREGLSDLRFTDAGRVPFPFARIMREQFNLCSVVTASKGPKLLDIDGHWSLDVTGSYGVNVAGYDQYKEWMQSGSRDSIPGGRRSCALQARTTAGGTVFSLV